MKIFGLEITRAAGDPAYYRNFNRAPAMDGGARAQLLAQPYKSSVWVMAAINLVTQPIKAVELKFYNGEVESQDARVREFWRKPAQGMSYGEFIDATAGWWKLAGEFFWLLDDTWLGRSQRKSPLIVARPDAMRAIKAGSEIVAWEYKTSGQTRVTFLPEQVVHVKRWNPYNPERGLGELDAAILAASTDRAASQFAYDTFSNKGDQGDYIVAKNGMPTEEQRQQIIAAVREKRAARLRGDFYPALLSGDFEITKPGITAPDAAFAANRLQNRHEVFAALGVPLSMADVQASYSIGSASDVFRLIFGTCMPLGTTIADAAAAVSRRMVGVQLDAEFDWDEHPTMQAVRAERVDSATKLAALGMPVREINDYLDMGLPEYPGWEVGYLPFSVQPVGLPLEEQTPEPGAAAEDGPVAMMLRALDGRNGKDGKHGCECCGEHAEMQALALRQPGSSWAAHWRARQGTMRLYAAKFNRQLMVARGQVISRVTKGAKSVAADFVFDLDEWEQGLQVEMRKAAQEAMDTAGKQCFVEIGNDDPWTMPPAKAISYLRSRENFFTNLADNIHTQILGSLEEGFQSGDTTDELAARIRAEFNGISKQRSLRIAMTETSAAYGAARQEALEQSGIEYKEWLTSGNENVRPSHRAAQGQIVEVSQPFIVGGASIMHPGDGSLGAPPAEIINCHCVALATEQKP